MFRVPYALAGKQWVTPGMVKKSDGPFQCVECHEPVQLRAGKQLRPHFAHLPTDKTLCGGGAGESWQHLAAKHMIAQHLGLWRFAPLCRACKTPDDDDSRNFAAARFHAHMEAPHGSFKVDVGVMDGKRMAAAIEVKHTHAVDAAKFAALENKCVHVIEVTACSVLESADHFLAYEPFAPHLCCACWTKSHCMQCVGCRGWFPAGEHSELGGSTLVACHSCRGECPDCGEWTLEHEIDTWGRCSRCAEACKRWLADISAATWSAPLGVRKSRVFRERGVAERLARELSEADAVMDAILTTTTRPAKRRRI